MTLTSTLQARGQLVTYLQIKMPATLTALAQALGYTDGLAAPATWVPLGSYFTVPEEQLPAVYVVVGNYTVAREWPDWYDVDLALRVVCVVAGRDRAECKDLATAYADAARFTIAADVTAGNAFQNIRVTAGADAGTDERDGQYRGSSDLTASVRVQLAKALPATEPTIPTGYPHLIRPIDRLPLEP